LSSFDSSFFLSWACSFSFSRGILIICIFSIKSSTSFWGKCFIRYDPCFFFWAELICHFEILWRLSINFHIMCYLLTFLLSKIGLFFCAYLITQHILYLWARSSKLRHWIRQCLSIFGAYTNTWSFFIICCSILRYSKIWIAKMIMMSCIILTWLSCCSHSLPIELVINASILFILFPIWKRISSKLIIKDPWRGEVSMITSPSIVFWIRTLEFETEIISFLSVCVFLVCSSVKIWCRPTHTLKIIIFFFLDS